MEVLHSSEPENRRTPSIFQEPAPFIENIAPLLYFRFYVRKIIRSRKSKMEGGSSIFGAADSPTCLARKELTETHRRRRTGQQPGTKSGRLPANNPIVNCVFCSPVGLHKILFVRSFLGHALHEKSLQRHIRRRPSTGLQPGTKSGRRPENKSWTNRLLIALFLDRFT